ncbi:MAG TPA: HEAT repeat domain-containing protein, partial [Candidatus Manganitrophaceae bacterium]|nr:HEAT repeat domain-containing protein [Candidatus Manganitrophaceae bacterium]
MLSFRAVFTAIGLALILQQTVLADGQAPLFKENDQDPPLDSILIGNLIERANDPDPYVRRDALEQLKQWDEIPAVREVLKSAIHDDVWLVRRAVVGRRYGTREDAFNYLIDEDPSIRYIGVGLVSRDGDPGVVDLLLDRLYDSGH